MRKHRFALIIAMALAVLVPLSAGKSPVRTPLSAPQEISTSWTPKLPTPYLRGLTPEPSTTTTTSPPPPPTTTTTTVTAPPVSLPPAEPSTPPTTTSSPPPAVSSGDSAIWACVREHESGDNYSENTGNGYYGAVQWLPSTWNAATTGAGYPQYANGRADLAPPVVQDTVAVYWQENHGWGQWSTAAGCGA